MKTYRIYFVLMAIFLPTVINAQVVIWSGSMGITPCSRWCNDCCHLGPIVSGCPQTAPQELYGQITVTPNGNFSDEIKNICINCINQALGGQAVSAILTGDLSSVYGPIFYSCITTSGYQAVIGNSLSLTTNTRCDWGRIMQTPTNPALEARKLTIDGKNLHFFEVGIIGRTADWRDSSFVVATADEKLIAEIQAELKRPVNNRRSVTGSLAKGGAGYNMNGPFTFNWHLVENSWSLQKFSQASCDGFPYKDVNQNLDKRLLSKFYCPRGSFIRKELFVSLTN
jgi:hypothetical protein